MHRTMGDVMKAMGGAKRGPMAGLANMLGFGGGGGPSPENGGARAKNAGRLRLECPAASLPTNFPRSPGGLPPDFPASARNLPAASRAFRDLGKKK